METFKHTPVPFTPLPDASFMAGEGGSQVLKNGALFYGCEFLSCGRDALFRIGALFKERKILWLPSYFCPSIKKQISEFFDIREFDDFPSEESPRFETLKAEDGDAVLSVNFFGLRDENVWKTWRKSAPRIFLIEDHSHAPFSKWAENSAADFSFASLRKYLPLPDGAYLKGRSFAPSPLFMRGAQMQDFAADALEAAALLKALGRYNAPVEDLYYCAETKLNSRKKPSRISKYSAELLNHLDFNKLELSRAENMRAFVCALGKVSKFKLLGAKFNPVLKFENESDCARAYAALSENNVLLSVYWGGFGKSANPRLLKEAQTLLCIPLDFRQTPAEAAAIAAILKKF